MRRIQWLNHDLPQTLYSAVLLSYFSAASIVLFGSFTDRSLAAQVPVVGSAIAQYVPLLLAAAFLAGGLGTAAEKKWGYALGSAAALYSAAATVNWTLATGFSINSVIRLMFDGAVVTMFFHPISRNYRRVWFR